MDTLKNLIIVGSGGFLGSALRYCVSLLFIRPGMMQFPAATLAVNASGSLLIGFLAVALRDAHEMWRLLFIVGILGGFTTFSSFSHETLVLFNNNQVFHAALNVLLNITVCLACVYAGFRLAKVVI
ncbi:MAG: fluoride efflux transporter CrcB [Elusimicrobium sp.]|nr:fluoride efflux transporter CrcB [Elusimicrobium sp.]